MSHLPLVIDLDGTLVHSDMLHESVLLVIKKNPFQILYILFLLFKGKAFLKQYLANQVEINPKTLPYNQELLEWLVVQREKGRRLILCTASDQKIANVIAKHLDIFDEVIASDGALNLAGKNKATILTNFFTYRGYDYAGNSHTDLPVWVQAHKAIVVNGTKGLLEKVRKISTVELVFQRKHSGYFNRLKILRIHQWSKNLLLFVPLFAAHDWANNRAWTSLIIAFVAFSLCASSMYITNDLLDLESDRLHPRKHTRPFASGVVPIWVGVLGAPLLLIISFAIATLIEQSFLYWLFVYFVVTCCYSLLLKRVILIDCIVLALLYTLRIIAGSSAAGHVFSFWLLAFSVFLFLSLAFIKRYAELEAQMMVGNEEIHGRGYRVRDAPVVQSVGVAAGYISVLILALYLNSDAMVKLYATPELLWGAVLVMLFWISWMWMQAHRGNMHDDPLVFAFKDVASLLSLVAFLVVLTVAAVCVL